MTNKHTVLLPDNTTRTRNSANRVYTHAVAVASTAATVIEENTAILARAEETGSRNGQGKRYYDAIEADLNEAKAAGSPEALVAWGVIAWAGRPDLAEKAAAPHRGRFAAVRIIEATLSH